MPVQYALTGLKQLLTPISETDIDLVLDSEKSYYMQEGQRVQDMYDGQNPIYPLVFALLSVNAPFGATVSAYKRLREEDTDLLDFWQVLHVLKTSHASDGVVSYAWTKAHWLMLLADSVQFDGMSYKPFPSDSDYRNYLQRNIKGLGYAKASFATMLVLGQADVACIDTHMYRMFMGTPAPKQILKRRYLALEESVRQLAHKHSIPTSVAQHCLWDAMRGIKSELLPS